jgi:hypothetical protein
MVLDLFEDEWMLNIDNWKDELSMILLIGIMLNTNLLVFFEIERAKKHAMKKNWLKDTSYF